MGVVLLLLLLLPLQTPLEAPLKPLQGGGKGGHPSWPLKLPLSPAFNPPLDEGGGPALRTWASYRRCSFWCERQHSVVPTYLIPSFLALLPSASFPLPSCPCSLSPFSLPLPPCGGWQSSVVCLSPSGLTLVRLVRLLCLACPLSRLAWLRSAASVVGRGGWCQGNKAWHQRLWPCEGISLYTMWSALAPTPLDSVEMVLHFMQLLTPSPLLPFLCYSTLLWLWQPIKYSPFRP